MPTIPEAPPEAIRLAVAVGEALARLGGEESLRTRIWVPRERRAGAETAAALRACGLDALAAPLWSVEACPQASLEPLERALPLIQALLLTSANGIQALAERVPGDMLATLQGLPAFAVGPETAARARGLGFANLRQARGDGASLARLVEGACAPGGGILFHPSGTAVSAEPTKSLEQGGFEILALPLYSMKPAEQVPEAVREFLADTSRARAVLLASSQAARLVEATCRQDTCPPAVCTRIIALARSQGVADALALPWKSVVRLDTP